MKFLASLSWWVWALIVLGLLVLIGLLAYAYPPVGAIAGAAGFWAVLQSQIREHVRQSKEAVKRAEEHQAGPDPVVAAREAAQEVADATRAATREELEALESYVLRSPRDVGAPRD